MPRRSTSTRLLLGAAALFVAMLLLESRDELMRWVGLRPPPAPPSAEELARRDAFCTILEETSAAYAAARADPDGARRVRGMEQARSDRQDRISRLLPERRFQRWPATVERVLFGASVELSLGGTCPVTLAASIGGADVFPDIGRRLDRGDAVLISGFFEPEQAGAGAFYVSGVAEAERMLRAEPRVELTDLELAP